MCSCVTVCSLNKKIMNSFTLMQIFTLLFTLRGESSVKNNFPRNEKLLLALKGTVQ
jgi:hypothetical protein